MAIYNTNFGFEQELDNLGDLSAEDAANYINNITVTNNCPVFGSFWTLANILSEDQYNGLRANIDTLTTQETGAFVKDMVDMLKIPGGENGYRGGLDFTSPIFLSFLSGICNEGIVEKIQDYTNAFQPPPVRKYGFVSPGQIITARQQSTENI
jgi:hypothetical protein